MHVGLRVEEDGEVEVVGGAYFGGQWKNVADYCLFYLAFLYHYHINNN